MDLVNETIDSDTTQEILECSTPRAASTPNRAGEQVQVLDTFISAAAS